MRTLEPTPRLAPDYPRRDHPHYDSCKQPACVSGARQADHAVSIYLAGPQDRIDLVTCRDCATAIERAQENGTLALPPEYIGRDSHVEVLYLEA